MDFHPFFVDEKGVLQKFSKEQEERINKRLNKDFKNSMAMKKIKMSNLYSAINNKLISGDKEFTEEEVHWIKIMCQESMPRMSKCFIVKQQIDGSTSRNRVPELLNVAFETTRSECMRVLKKIADQLANIDTIPGDGVTEPKAFTLPGGGVFDNSNYRA